MLTLVLVILASIAAAGVVVLGAILSLTFTSEDFRRSPALQRLPRNRARLFIWLVVLAATSAVLTIAKEAALSSLEIAPGEREGMSIKPTTRALQREIKAEARDRANAAIKAFAIGDEQLRHRKFVEAAKAYHDSALLVPSKAAFVNLGVALRASSDLHGAKKAFKQALDTPTRTPDGKVVHANAVLQYGSILSALGEKSEALTYLLDAQRRFQAERSRLGQAASDYELAAHRYRNGETAAAQQDLVRADSGFRDLDYDLGIANVTLLSGIISSDQGRIEDAERSLADALLRYRTLGNDIGEAVVALQIGTVRHSRCDIDRALASYDDGARLAARAGDKYVAAMATAAVANMYIERRDAAKALRAVEQTLRLCKNVKAPDVEAWALMYRAAAHQLAGRFDAARADLATASVKFAETDKLGSISVTAEEGKLLLALGQTDKALARLQSALQASQKAKYHQLSGLILIYMADVYLKLGDRQSASESLLAARRIYDAANLHNCDRRTLDDKLMTIGL